MSCWPTPASLCLGQSPVIVAWSTKHLIFLLSLHEISFLLFYNAAVGLFKEEEVGDWLFLLPHAAELTSSRLSLFFFSSAVVMSLRDSSEVSRQRRKSLFFFFIRRSPSFSAEKKKSSKLFAPILFFFLIPYTH